MPYLSVSYPPGYRPRVTHIMNNNIPTCQKRSGDIPNQSTLLAGALIHTFRRPHHQGLSFQHKNLGRYIRTVACP